MKKSSRLFMASLLIGGLALSFSSCKDSENVSNIPNTPEEIAQSKETEMAKNLLSILSFTSELDSLPDNWFANNYTQEPTIGDVVDASTPFVRYVAVQDKNEAINKYNSFANNGIEEGSTSASWNVEGVGSVNFNVLDQADVFATLDLNIKQQPHLSQIRFVPASALGDNASFKGEPYYTFGDVVALHEGNPGIAGNTSYWICVRPCSSLESKKKSHWMSFQLNDWDSKNTKGVPSGSVNIKKLTESGKQDYYLPTKLGNESESREHLVNLFNLLRIIDNTNRYTTAAYPNGIGGVSRAEFSQNNAEKVAANWDKYEIWKKVLPQGVNQQDLKRYFSQNEEINVFYYGYHSTPSVYRSKLTLDNNEALKGPNQKESDELSWKRGIEGVDFREYITKGAKGKDWNVKDLPNTGFIVRYKTGAQLVGSYGNDDHPTKSFTEDSKDITDLYVYRTEKNNTSNYGTAAMGDCLVITDDVFDVCVLNNTKEAPNTWNDCSYFFAFNNSEDIVMQDKAISTSAYLHLLNALILDSEAYKLYTSAAGTNKMPKFTSNYEKGLKNMLLKLKKNIDDAFINTGIVYDDNQIIETLEFKAEDANGGNFFNEDNIKNLAKFSIQIAFVDQNTKADKYNTATLTYNLKTGKYTLSNITRNVDRKSYIFNLKAYKDAEQLVINDENLDFEKNENYDNAEREVIKQESIAFLKNNQVQEVAN